MREVRRARGAAPFLLGWSLLAGCDSRQVALDEQDAQSAESSVEGAQSTAPSEPARDADAPAEPPADASAAAPGESQLDAAVPAEPLPAQEDAGAASAVDADTPPARAPLDRLGPHAVEVEENVGAGFEAHLDPADLSGEVCGWTVLPEMLPPGRPAAFPAGYRADLYALYRPAELEAGRRYPVVSWGNAGCVQHGMYAPLLRQLASHGFLVIASNARTVNLSDGMTRGLDFLSAAGADPQSPLYGHVDMQQVAALGHSIGAVAAAAAASDARVQTVVLLNGAGSAAKPFLTLSGDRDLGEETPENLAKIVGAAPKAAYLFFHQLPATEFAGHLMPLMQPERLAGPLTAWLRMLLHADAQAAAWFVGNDCALCNRSAEFAYGQHGL